MSRQRGVPSGEGGGKGEGNERKGSKYRRCRHTGPSGSVNGWEMKESMTHTDERNLQNEM